MKLVEVDGKRLLSAYGLSHAESVFLPAESAGWPAGEVFIGPGWLKAQVLSGRRFKNGLVARVDSKEQVASAISTMKANLHSLFFSGFLFERHVPYLEEWFISVDVDRLSGTLRLHVSEKGGVNAAAHKTLVFKEVEEVLPAIIDDLHDVVRSLVAALENEDAISIEINPLARLPDGSWLPLDAKIELDDSALSRHPDRILITPRKFDRVDLDGDIATIFFGGGASLIAMDALLSHGGRPANFMESSGNPDPAALKQEALAVLSRPNLRGLWVAGSHANFTDIYETLRAILEAYDELNLDIPVVIRRDGPRTAEAEAMAAEWAKRNGRSFMFGKSDKSLEDSAIDIIRMASSYVSSPH